MPDILPAVSKFVQISPFGHGRFLGPFFEVLGEGVKIKVLIFSWAFAIKSFVRSIRMFRYCLLTDILSKGEKTRQ